MRILTLPLLGLILLSACGPFILDDDDGELLVIGTSSGEIQGLSAGTDQAGVTWSAAIDSSSQVAIASDGPDLFVGSGQELLALDSSTGEALWAAPAAFDSTVVGLAGPGSGVVVVQTFDCLIALQAADGQELWRRDFFELDGAADSAVAVVGEAVVLGGDPIRRLDIVTGEVSHEADGSQDISAVVAEGSSLYVASPDGVLALSSGDLQTEWLHTTDDDVDNLSVGGGTVFYSVLAGGVGALSSSGDVLGVAEPGEVFQALDVQGGSLLAGRSDGTLFAFDAATVGELWSVPGFDSTVWDLTASSLTVFFATGGGLDGLNLEDSSSLWSFQTDGDIVAAQAF